MPLFVSLATRLLAIVVGEAEPIPSLSIVASRGLVTPRWHHNWRVDPGTVAFSCFSPFSYFLFAFSFHFSFNFVGKLKENGRERREQLWCGA